MTNLNDLSNTILEQLQRYAQTLDEDVEKAVQDVSKDLVQKLKQDSPKGKRKGKKYAQGWKIKKQGTKKATVFNSQYQLTHLLEHGHALKNGGRARAFPHIAPNEEIAIREFLSKIERAARP